jgi:hypothetical protein
VQAPLLAGLFELGGELASAVDLHRANGKGHAVLKVSRNSVAAAAVALLWA